MLASASCSRSALRCTSRTFVSSPRGKKNERHPGSERCMATGVATRTPRRQSPPHSPLRRFFPQQTQAQLFAISPDSNFHGPTRNTGQGARFKMQLAECADNGHAARALRICAEMKQAQITPDVTTYDWLIHACAKQGLANECIALLEDMESLGLRPTVETYNHIIYAQRWSKTFNLEDLLDRMEQAHIRRNTHTYHHMILRHAEAQNLEMCLQCFAEMSEHNVSPTLKSAQKVIGLASRLGHARLALDLAYAFEGASVRKLEAQDWTRILSASTSCHFQSGVVDAWQKAVVEHNVTPDEGQCIEVLHTAGRHGLPDLGLHALQVLRQLGVPMQEYHLAPMVEAFCKHNMLEDAFAILNLMRTSGIPVVQETALPIFNCIRDDVDEVDKAWGILEKMNSEGKTVDVVSLNVIIQASVLLKDLQRAIGTYKAFSDLGVKPSIDTFNYLISGCVSASHKDLGEKMLVELREHDLIPDARTFGTVVHLFLTQTTYEEAFFYLEEMKGQGHRPPLKVYEALVKKCIVSGDARWRLALDELRECGYSVTPELQQFIDTGGRFSSRSRVTESSSGEIKDDVAQGEDVPYIP